jgi:hypothetical protein
LLLEAFEFFWGTWAGLALLTELGSNGTNLLANVL